MFLGQQCASSGWCNGPLNPPNTCPSATAYGPPKPVSHHRSGQWAIPTTAPSPESVIGPYKTELIRRGGPWHNPDQVKYVTLDYVDWFNWALRENVGWVG